MEGWVSDGLSSTYWLLKLSRGWNDVLKTNMLHAILQLLHQ